MSKRAGWFTDATGQKVIFQTPNIPIIVWAAAWVAAKLLGESQLAQPVSQIGSMALAIWAYLELAHGVNRFRRILGAVVLAGLIVRAFNA